MRNLEHIDQIFSDSLRDYSKAPPANLWALVKNELDRASGKDENSTSVNTKKNGNHPSVN